MPEYGLAELVEGHEVAALMFPNEFVEVGIDLYVILVQLLLEFLATHTSQGVLLQGASQLLLIRVQTLTWGTRQLHSLGAMEVLVVGLHRRRVRGVLFQIGVVVKGMGDFRVLDLSHLLSADVIYEFRCRLDSDLSFNLLNKSICIDLPGVESFENIIQSACCTVIKLILIK